MTMMKKNNDRNNKTIRTIRNQAVAEPKTNVSYDEIGTDPAKRTVVILGSGWGAVSFVKSLKKDIPFEVILVSPRNYFLYTPLLPGVATGAIETRSIVESIRRPIAEKGFKYYEAAATDIDAKNKIVTCRKANNEFTLKYDYLITAVGAVTNTFGVPGVE